MKVSKKNAERLLYGVKIELRNRDRSHLEEDIALLDEDLRSIAIPQNVPWIVNMTMPRVLERLRATDAAIRKRKAGIMDRARVLSALTDIDLERRYGNAARTEFAKQYPDAAETLERATRERHLIDEAAKSATRDLGFFIRPFREARSDVVVLGETFKYGGATFRLVDSDPDGGSEPLHWMIYADDIPRAPALGTLSLNNDDEVHTVFNFNEMPFSEQVPLPDRTIESALQTELGSTFRARILQTVEFLTYDENHITMSLVEALHRTKPWQVETKDGVALVHLRAYKQISTAEKNTGDICILVERSAPDISGVGVCYLEAKRRYVNPPLFKMLSAAQLNRIREHTDYAALLLYDPNQQGDWICSTIRAEHVLTTNAKVRDVGVALSEAGMPFCDRLITRYFRLQEVDRKVDAVKSAAREARRRYAATLVALVGVGQDVEEARMRIKLMNHQLDHIVEYGMTFEQRQREIEIDRERGYSIDDDLGLGL